jgi:hypothetical protein
MGMLHEAFENAYTHQTREEIGKAAASRAAFEREMLSRFNFVEHNKSLCIELKSEFHAKSIFPTFFIGVLDEDCGIEIIGKHDDFELEIGGYREFPIFLPLAAFMQV